MGARSKQPRRPSRTAIKTRSGRKKHPSGDEPFDDAQGRRLGVISDTHGLMRPEALAALQGVDHILHAGDIGGDHVIDALRAIAPVTFVRGNNDDDDGYAIERLTIGMRRILLTHIFRDALLEGDADVIIVGHSHKPRNEVIGGKLVFNPGSAGPRRFKLPVTVGIIESGRAYHVDLQSAHAVP